MLQDKANNISSNCESVQRNSVFSNYIVVDCLTRVGHVMKRRVKAQFTFLQMTTACESATYVLVDDNSTSELAWRVGLSTWLVDDVARIEQCFLVVVHWDDAQRAIVGCWRFSCCLQVDCMENSKEHSSSRAHLRILTAAETRLHSIVDRRPEAL